MFVANTNPIREIKKIIVMDKCRHKCFNIRQVIVNEREMPSKKLVFPMAFFCHRKVRRK